MQGIVLLAVFLIGVVASFYGVTVGSGGLVSISGLIFLGLSPQVAIATNRLAALGLISAGLYRFNQAKKVNYKLGFSLTLTTLIGSVVGANLLIQISEGLLEKIVGGLILVMLTVLLFKKELGIKAKLKELTVSRKILGYFFSLLIGVYIGFFGGGWSTLFSYLLILVFGQTFLESAGTRKIVGLFASLAALTVFVLNQKVNYLYGLTMFTGMALGSYLGASYALKKGNLWVKRLFIIVVFLSALKLMF